MSYIKTTWTDKQTLINSARMNNIENGIESVDAGISGIKDNIAPEFSSESAYPAGDCVFHEGLLYRFKTAHSAGAWDSSEVDQVTVTDIIEEASASVGDVQINGTSIVSGGVANVPEANDTVSGVVKATSTRGVSMSNGFLTITPATEEMIKAGTEWFKPLGVRNQNASAFYGLAKAAGDSTQSASSNAVGTYTDEAKAAIQHMLGTDINLADYESDTTADQAYAIGELFMLNGKLHQATVAITAGDTLTVGTNCSVVNAADVFPHDVQVGGTSIVVNGVANIPPTGASKNGYVRIDSTYGVNANEYGRLYIQRPDDSAIKAGTNQYRPVVPSNQHTSIFYGLAKAAGDSTQSESSNAVGTYTDAAKVAIQKMLGVYEAPWELINEETFTNATEADYIISTDSNNQTFELTDAAIFFESPVQDTFAKKGTHMIVFISNNTSVSSAEVGSYTQDANTAAHGCAAFILQKNGILITVFKKTSTSGNNGGMNMRYYEGFNGSNDALRIFSQEQYITSIKIGAVTGKGHYKLLGKRRWRY